MHWNNHHSIVFSAAKLRNVLVVINKTHDDVTTLLVANGVADLQECPDDPVIVDRRQFRQSLAPFQ